jgi:hypothetical protein
MNSSSLYDYGSWVSIYFNPAGYYQVSARACNTCGYSPWAFVYVDAGSKSPSPVYPNPVSDILYVEVGSSDDAKGVILTYDIRLYDGMGNQMRQTGIKGGNTVQLNVSNLPNGNYFLHIYDGVSSTPEVQKIIVKH